MQDFQQSDQTRSSGQDSAGVNYFASQVVSLLAERSSRSTTEPLEVLVSGLIRASQSGTKEAFAQLLNEMRKSRVSVAALADIYIPLAARRMGEAWHEDEMSWLEVSIGVGRLQSLLRNWNGLGGRSGGRCGAWDDSDDHSRPRTAYTGANGGDGSDAAVWRVGLPADRPKSGRTARVDHLAGFRWHHDFCRHSGQVGVCAQNRKVCEVSLDKAHSRRRWGCCDVQAGGCGIMHWR